MLSRGFSLSCSSLCPRLVCACLWICVCMDVCVFVNMCTCVCLWTCVCVHDVCVCAFEETALSSSCHELHSLHRWIDTICTWFLQSKSFCSIPGQLELGHRQLPLSSSGGELVGIRLDEQEGIICAWCLDRWLFYNWSTAESGFS